MSRNLDRRSFLIRVAGGALLAGTGLAIGGPGEARQTPRRAPTRQMRVDADPRDPARPIPPRTQGVGRQQPRPRPSLDSDPGDAAGSGHGPVGRIVICPGHRRCPRRLP